MDEYWKAVRDRVCMKCIDSDGEGNCRLPEDIDCALQLHLPLIVETVKRIQSDQMGEYVRELRTIVCGQCKYQTVNGNCTIRAQVDCALDRYFPMVVEAIEEVESSRNRPSAR